MKMENEEEVSDTKARTERSVAEYIRAHPKLKEICLTYSWPFSALVPAFDFMDGRKLVREVTGTYWDPERSFYGPRERALEFLEGCDLWSDISMRGNEPGFKPNDRPDKDTVIKKKDGRLEVHHYNSPFEGTVFLDRIPPNVESMTSRIRPMRPDDREYISEYDMVNAYLEHLKSKAEAEDRRRHEDDSEPFVDLDDIMEFLSLNPDFDRSIH